jgi:hypothetical protein
MDTDFLVMHPLASILSHLETHHIVSYTVNNGENSQACGGGDGAELSSNWHAGRKGNAVSEARDRFISFHATHALAFDSELQPPNRRVAVALNYVSIPVWVRACG